MTKKAEHTVTFVFGEEATRRFDDPDMTLAKLEDYGDVRTVTFDTKEELDAYIEGVEDAAGWLDACAIDLDDYPNLRPDPET